MTDDDLPPLPPCPFCGHADSLLVYHNPMTVLHPWFRVECDYCGAKGPGSDRGDHLELWSNRFIDAALAAKGKL